MELEEEGILGKAIDICKGWESLIFERRAGLAWGRKRSGGSC